ncbi:MAG: G1 family glutamic endopeptidase [Streptosporangiaceae bacterium]
MRHRFSLLGASIGLVLGGTLAAAYPAAAATSQPGGGTFQPGGLMALSNGTRPAGGVSRVSHQTVTSSNWSGYAATGGPFTSVSADWVQPAGNCSGGGGQYAAFWVGLDGYSSSTVEQTGTEVDCVGRTAEYYAWTELYPGASKVINATVRAGDQFAASVTYIGNYQYTLYLHDITRGWTYSTSPQLHGAARSSAEVIAEAPSSQYGVLPLANFGTASFTNAEVTTNSTKSLGAASPVQITMRDGSATVSVSGLTNNGQNFTATYSGSRQGRPGPF